MKVKRDREFLRQKLLATGEFEDNNFLDLYIQLIATREQLSEQIGCEIHHILPRSYYRACNQEVDNTESNLARLQYVDHCHAHWLLANCTRGKLQKDSCYAYRCMINQLQAKELRDLTEAERAQLQH